MKKIVAIALLICFLLVLPMEGRAEDVVDSGKCGDNVYWKVTQNEDWEYTLVIYGTGPTYDFNYNYDDQDKWSELGLNIKPTHIVIEEGVTRIGDALFSSSVKNFESAYGDNFEARTIMRNVRTVTIPGSVTSIGRGAFACAVSHSAQEITSGSALETVTFLELDTLTSIGESAFYNCPKLKEFIIPDGVTAIEDFTFGQCSGLKKVTVPDSVTRIGDRAFENCKSLTDITIPDSVTSMDYGAFMYCESLKEIHVPGSVTEVGDNLFGGCKALETCTLSAGLPKISDAMFIECSSLKTIHIPNTVTAIGNWAFDHCVALEEVAIPDSVVSIDANAFSRCSSLNNVTIPASVKTWGMFIFSECTSLTNVSLPGNMETIPGYMFNECAALQKIDIPDGVTQIDEGAFMGCTSLNSVKVPKNVQKMGQCVFQDCTSLESMKLPDGLEIVPNSAFSGCTSLKSVNIPGSVTQIEMGAFWECSDLTTVTFGKGTEPLDIGNSAFYCCTSLKEVTFPERDIGVQGYAFSGCTALEAVTMPKKNVYLNQESFSECASLRTVTIPEGEGYFDVYEAAFRGCTSLTDLTVPKRDGGTSFGSYAFDGCSNLQRVTFLGDVPIDMIAFMDNPSIRVCYPADNETWAEEDLSWLEGVDFSPFTPCDSHSFGSWVAETAATCSAGGTESRTCSKCDYKEFRHSDALPHTEVVVAAKEPTCTRAGATEGKRCSVCGAVTVASKEIPALGHEKVTIPGREPTCTTPGLTEGKQCSRCGKVTAQQTEIPALDHHFVSGKCTLCGEKDPDWVEPTEPHTHAWGEGVITTPATCTAEGVKTYTCECGETKTETIPVIAHTEVTDTAVVATCTATGLTEGKHCSACNTVLVKQETVPAKPHTYADGKCTVCGAADPDWVEPTQPTEPEPTEPEPTEPEPTEPEPTEPEDPTEPEVPEELILRLAGLHRYETAFKAADQMKKNLGIAKFDAVVVASGMDFADALSGSYLATVKNAPILLACNVDWVNDLVKDYINASLNPGGTVYILGGEKAIPESFREGLDSFTVTRLAGAHRFETNLMVLKEAGIGDKPILVATGLTFADSLSASAAKLPILLVYGDKLLDDQAAFLEENKGRNLCILGGEGAVNAKMETVLTAYGTVERVAGNNRFETSVKIAEKFFASPESAVLAYAWDFPDGLCGGPLAVTMNAPLILTMEKYESQAAAYIQSNTISKATILGGEKLIPDTSVDLIMK